MYTAIGDKEVARELRKAVAVLSYEYSGRFTVILRGAGSSTLCRPHIAML
jgi:hypothetical protein